jgi:hypothetical protein
MGTKLREKPGKNLISTVHLMEEENRDFLGTMLRQWLVHGSNWQPLLLGKLAFESLRLKWISQVRQDLGEDLQVVEIVRPNLQELLVLFGDYVVLLAQANGFELATKANGFKDTDVPIVEKANVPPKPASKKNPPIPFRAGLAMT